MSGTKNYLLFLASLLVALMALHVVLRFVAKSKVPFISKAAEAAQHLSTEGSL